MTCEDAEYVRYRHAETDAKGIGQLLDLTVQRIYQLEKEGVIARTGSGNYNIADCLAGYFMYKRTGEVLPPCTEHDDTDAFFLEIADDTMVTDAQLAALLGISPAYVERLTVAEVFEAAEPRRGIAEYIGIDAIAALDLRQLLSGETDETVIAAERRRAALIDAVRTADSMNPSSSQWELHAVQSCWNAFVDSLPADIVGEARA